MICGRGRQAHVPWLDKVPFDVQGAVEHTENVDVAVLFYEIGDAVVFVKENTNLTRRCALLQLP